ncbi:MAG: hypothetical protein N2249_07115 [Melioribacter sp.]|nr:hypothetical protein [Melioribacter sp.]
MNNKINIEKYYPIVPIILLTIFLMIISHYNKENVNKLIQNSKNDIITYVENLVPLISSTQLDNEDIINFAFYEIIPIDKQTNKILIINNEPSNIQIHELENLPFNKETKNYKRLINYFELNNKEKVLLDSILNFYKKELSLSILSNNNSTIAINPKLLELQKVIQVDLIYYLMNVNGERVFKFFGDKKQLLSGINLSEFISNFKSVPFNEYIFISSDTVFRKTFTIDTTKFNKKIKTARQEMQEKLDKIDIKISFEKFKNNDSKYNFRIDSNFI